MASRYIFMSNLLFRITCRRFVTSKPLCSAHVIVQPRAQFSANAPGTAPQKEKFPEHLLGKRCINYNELSALLNECSIVLIDVRDAADYVSAGHIPGAVNIPLDQLKTALKMSEEEFLKTYGIQKPKHSDENIVFYGLSDVLSSAASEIAHGMGYKKSKFYPDGWAGWTAMCSR